MRARKTISVRVPTYFPVEVAQHYLDEISREIPEKLLLLGVKFDVALADLEGKGRAAQKPYQLLGRRDLPPEIRSAAARSMMGYRGAIALREKMKPLGYPNLAKAREAQKRKVAERRLPRLTGRSASTPPQNRMRLTQSWARERFSAPEQTHALPPPCFV